MSKAILITCMDCRHDGKITDAIRNAADVEHSFYHITAAGGVGVLSKGFSDLAGGILFQANAAIEHLEAEEVFISVHGTSEHDAKGCGGYALCGHGHHYETPEASRVFSYDELALAAKRLRDEGVTLPIRAFYVTFGPDGENLIEEVLLESERVVDEMVLQAA
jgi:hypothetical protein